MAGTERVCWELTLVAENGPIRLALHHSQGSIVEYFDDVTAALLREQQLEQLLIAAKSSSPAPSSTNWVEVAEGVH